MALEQKGRPVVAITLKDLEEATIEKLDRFFLKVVNCLKGYKV
jgi:hypothetical protein